MELFFALLGMGLFVALGGSALARGRQATREHGPDHPVQIFIPRRGLARLAAEMRGPDVVHARTAVRLGWFFIVISPVFFPVVYGFDAFNPVAIHRRANSACQTALTAEDLDELLGWNAELDHIVDTGRHCRAAWAVDDERVLHIDIGPGGSFPSGSLYERKQRNARRSEPQTVTELGDDALLMTGGPTDTVYARFAGTQLRLQADPGRLGESAVQELLDRLWERRGLLAPYQRPSLITR